MFNGLRLAGLIGAGLSLLAVAGPARADTTA